jgi:hypothetical protein
MYEHQRRAQVNPKSKFDCPRYLFDLGLTWAWAWLLANRAVALISVLGSFTCVSRRRRPCQQRHLPMLLLILLPPRLPPRLRLLLMLLLQLLLLLLPQLLVMRPPPLLPITHLLASSIGCGPRLSS